MRNGCDDAWEPLESEVEALEPFAPRSKAVCAIGLVDGAPPWRVAEVAGLSGGKTTDPEKRRLNLASAFSKQVRRGGVTLPNIAALQKTLEDHRRGGSESEGVLTRQERREILSRQARYGGTIAERRAAVSELNKMDLKDASDDERQSGKLKLRAWIRGRVAEVGVADALAGFRLLKLGTFEFQFPDLFVDSPIVEPETTDDIHSRLSRLEEANERSGDIESSASTGSERAGSGRISGGRGGVALPVDERRGVTVRAGAGK